MGNSNSTSSGDVFNLLDPSGNVCDSECRRKQELASLENTYETAEFLNDIAPIEYNIAKKNYFTALLGANGFNSMEENDLETKANTIATTLQDSFNKSYQDAITMLQSYQSNYINLNNSKELLEHYSSENTKLEKDISVSSSDILTHDRKTFYEYQSIDQLKKYYKWLKYFYIFMLFIYLLFIFMIPSTYSRKKDILIFILLVIYPFIIIPILSFFYKIYTTIKNFFPKDIYKSL
jgi:hypothetical protein